MKRKALDRNIIDGLREPKQERKDVRPRDDDKKKKTSAMIKNEAHQPPTARSETSATSKDQASHQVLSSAPTTNEEASSPTAKKQAAARRKLLNASDVDASDDLLAREWNEMSRKERERTQEEVHGVVSAAVEEAPEFVRKRIGQMDDEISKYRKKFAYDRALFFSPSDVKDRNFSLLFLRAVDFHPRKAADRMIAFFELKLELFGIETLVRPITLDDITEEDKEPLEAGTHQFLPEKDRAGRAVFCGLFNLFKAQRDTRTQCRSLFYQIMVGLEDDIEAQKKGVVLVLHAYQFDDDMLRMEEMIKSFSIFFKALPWKPMGIHYCCPKEEMSTLRPFEQFFQLVIGKEGRKRFRTHHGSNIECQFALMSFGIPMKDFSLEKDGSKAKSLAKNYLERRKAIEEERRREQGTAILAPDKLDTLLGRGKPIQEWPGNVRLCSILGTHLERHREAVKRRGAKNALCDEIVESIKSSGGRFLKREEGGSEWVEVDDAVAREKISHGFRNQKQAARGNSPAPASLGNQSSDG